jgi:hypothetical protein
LQHQLKYPPFAVRLKKRASGMFIFDEIRKKWLALTPEEWVRQHVLNHLVSEKKIPPSIISVEKELVLNDLRRRYDIVVYDREHKPWLIVECKAPYITLDQRTIDQALRYNITVRAPYLMISNGVSDCVYNKAGVMVDLPDFAG